ncbi:ORF 310 [Sulfolobus spindle-shaped virus 2]|uniref:Fuselloviral protein SSV2p10 n=2 Tax=root TaxID=1 RepID=A0A157SYV8_SACSO|nr:hypothetical protein [Saccharolobus solfataricus]NP_944462.1 ORF 310 [Sulfolobus spindle-shaped virus 2]AAQ73257.1 ORF 310 [Sulfolobus spindle-shaped virus 2]SAI84255.1 Fuselloviral protein SSV2p10 [Saccharolobus solfataricus]
MSHTNANSNGNSDSQTTTKKLFNNSAVRQLAVRQPAYKTNSNTTPLSQKEGLDTQNLTHSISLSDREKLLELLKQDRTLLEQVEILKLLERIREEGLVGNAMIFFRVSYALKELYDRYYAPKKPTLSPKLQAIREAIFRIILDDLILSRKIDAETLRQLGYEVPNLEEVKKAERVVYMPIIQKEETEEKEEKEEQNEETEFERELNEFENFLMKFIFIEKNMFKNGYIVTKPLADQIFEYLDKLIEMANGNVKTKLVELKESLSNNALNEKHFSYTCSAIDRLPIAIIPKAVRLDIEELLQKMVKRKKLR